MTVNISTDAEIDSVRLAEQAAKVVAVTAGYWALYAKETGLFVEDDNEVELGPLGSSFEPGGRLTLTTATPVTTADVTAAATLYYTPYKHDMISLYDGARWIPVPFAELSLNIGAYTASKPYDIWAYLNAGAVALDSTVWTNATTRATALAYQNGRLIKNGDATRFYLGTIYINGSGGETDDSVIKRNVWNYYNQKMRECYKEDTTGSWTYETASWRNANNSAANRIEYTCGLIGEGGLDLSVSCAIGLDGGVTTGVSIGENGTTPHAKMSGQYATVHNAVATTFSMAQGHLKLAGATGFNYYQWIELGANSGGTTTFYGHIAGRAANIAGYVLG